MKELECFISPDIAGVPVPGDAVAYRMDDDKNNMRMQCGMGGSASCDYFMVREKSVVLIEDTFLQESAQTLEGECAALANDKEKRKYVIQSLRRENALKIYGSLLVLCRLSARFPSVQQVLAEKTYDFWLVARDENFDAESGYVKSGDLRGRLQGTLGKKTLRDINIIHLGLLEKVFQQGFSASS